MSRYRQQTPRTVANRDLKTKSTHRFRFAWQRCFWCGLVLAPIALWYVASSFRIVQAEQALGRGEFQVAFMLATQELQADHNSDRALMVAGSACLTLPNISAAKSFFSRVSKSRPRLLSLAERQLSRIALDAGQAAEAEELLRKSLRIVPDDPTTLDQLIYLLTLEGRSWEARALVLERLHSGIVTSNYLMIAGTQHPNLGFAVKYAERCLSAVPDDPLPRLVLAQQAWRDNQPQIARTQLVQVLRKYPDLLEAHALLCQVLVETGTSEEFVRACDRLPSTASSHPEIWLAQGVWAENHGQVEAAARCYWEALRLEPNLPNANYRLSRALVTLGKADFARPFAERAQHLTELSFELPSLLEGIDPTKLPSIIRQLEHLGRDWEAAGWCRMLLLEKGQQPAWARTTQLRLYRRLLTCASFTSPASDPSRQIDLSHYRLPVHGGTAGPTPTPPHADKQRGQVAFQDDADRTGLKFTYHNGAPQGDLESMLEMNGGGVAVLDYDGDLRPDLFFTQGGNLPPAPFDSTQSDRFFRNRAGDDLAASAEGWFEDVTESAGIRDLGYGQGVTVGDFDNDGLPDLYVGNIGRNQLYHNNGDGTFTDVTANAETQAGGWTSSCVLADFNQDGYPDLYVVTYLDERSPYRPCSKRAPVRCSPLNYPAESDRFYLNLGDGRFRDLTDSHGLAAPEGRGLGVVAADFDGSRRLSLFVANDMSANFYFLNQTTAPDVVRFTEQALLSGLAFDHLGQAKACMGVAAGDYNGDGRLDLFVTNFYRQSNDLYTQQADGSFHDRSRETRLFDPSFLQLGWGTQFLDADLDGHPDLIVTNGHVHEPLDPKIPYQMPSQFFHNRGDGTFAELSSEKLGEFFQRKRLGRSLARLDWNRDGREDACILHLNQPVALLTNQTDQPGHFLALRLVGVDSARDAIGARVQVSIGDQTWTSQLTAGDGFHASNERRLVFGLADHQTADSVAVLWPSGSRQEFQHLKPNREWLLIEHRPPRVLRQP